MSTLSSDQLSDIQADLGIDNTGTVFTDAELHRLFTRAGADYDRTVVYALDQLMMDAAKLNDYTSGASQEKKSQVFTQLKAMREMWARRAGVGLGTVRAGVIDMDFQEKGD